MDLDNREMEGLAQYVFCLFVCCSPTVQGVAKLNLKFLHPRNENTLGRRAAKAMYIG